MVVRAAAQTTLTREDWQAFWDWESKEDVSYRKPLIYLTCGLYAALFVVGLFADKILAITAVVTAPFMAATIGAAFGINHFFRSRIVRGDPVVTFDLRGYTLGRRFCKWPSRPFTIITGVSLYDFPSFLVLAIDTKVHRGGVHQIRIPFCVKDRGVRAAWARELRERAGLSQSEPDLTGCR